MVTIRELIAERMGPAMFIDARRKEELTILEKSLMEVCEMKNIEPETAIGLVRKEMDVSRNCYFTQALTHISGNKWFFRLDKQMTFEPLEKPKETLPEKPKTILRKQVALPEKEEKRIFKPIIRKKVEELPKAEEPKPVFKPLLKKKRPTESLQPSLFDLD